MARPRIHLEVLPDPGGRGVLVAGHWLRPADARHLADQIHDLLDRQELNHD